MGFGILFIGYFFTLTINLGGLNIPPHFIGYLLMFWACYKLMPYSSYFKKTSYTLIALSAMSVWLFSSELGVVYFSQDPLVFYDEVSFLKILVSALMHFYLLKALIEISTDVGRVKISIKCKRNIFITLAVLTCHAIISNPFIDLGIEEFLNSVLVVPATETLAPITETLVPSTSEIVKHEVALGLNDHITSIAVNFVVILNMIQIFSCYMWICYEGDEEMELENAKDPLSKLTAKMAKENAEYKESKNKSKKKKK
ncbi:MAG: hypothetical protein E7675_05890 [Ruminococcaceae bacterium]|nr:hypothetical protein [Oscillospiraceae bacterium]